MALPIAGWAQLFINPPTFSATNTVHVTLSGAGATNAYVIFYTPDLTTSFNSWAPIVTGAVGQTTFALATTTNTNAFYRAGVAPPFAPTGLSATPGNAQVLLSWHASSGATSYNVKQALVSGGPYTTIATGVTATNNTDKNLTNGTTYYFVVSAVNASGESANSSQVSAMPSTNLTPVTSGQLANLPVGRANVALTSGGATATANSFITGYGPGLAIDGVSSTAWIPVDRPTNDVSPDWLIVDFHTNGTLEALVLSGEYLNRAAGTYVFQYTTDPSPLSTSSTWTTIGSYTWSSANPLPRTGFVFPNVPNVTGVQLLSYRNPVYNNAYNNGSAWYCWGNSIQELEAYTPAAPSTQPPGAPTGLNASAANGQVTLNWTASAGATAYNVKRATVSGGPYTNVVSGIAPTTYTDTGLSNGTTYYYVVSAVNAYGESANSSEVSATPMAISVPAAAAGAGYTNLVFDDEFNSINTIDVNNTGAPGYNWYVQLPFGGGTVPSSAYTVSNGVLVLAYGDHSASWALSTWNCAGNTGHAFRYGYFEARVHFDPTLGTNAAYWPAFWSFPIDHTCGSASHWNELDFFEAYTGGFASYSGAFVGTVHDWTYNGSYINCQNANNYTPTSVDWNQWHILGCLWKPGQISWYLDNNLLETQYYSATGTPNPCANCTSGSGCATGLFSVMDSESNLVILGSSEHWPMYVDWVHAWQQ